MNRIVIFAEKKMSMKQIIIISAALFLGICQAEAQNYKRPETYNYQRGIEAISQDRKDEALEYFIKDSDESPQSGYPYIWMAYLYLTNEENGKALDAANRAIRFLPKRDVDYLTHAYEYRVGAYLCLGDTVKALADLQSMVKMVPENTDAYNTRAQIYYEQEKYGLSDADYRRMTELRPGDVRGYMGLGRNANAQKRWSDAVKHFDYVTKLASDFSSGYAFRAQSYIGLQKWNEATDDIVKALSLNWDRIAHYLAVTINEQAFSMLVAKLKVQSVKEPNEAKWPFIIATMYEQSKNYQKAIDYYKDANAKDRSENVYDKISYCQYKLGNYDEAMTAINQALNMDSTEVNFYARKANIFYEIGNVKAAIAEWDKVLTMQPESGFGYYRRGWFKELAGDLEGGLEDLSMAIVLDPDGAYLYSTRGDLYMRLGKKDLAEADFRKTIELEDSPEKYDFIHYAYQGLGQFEMAKKIAGYIKLQVPAGKANPSPPIGPALGQRGLNIMEFCKAFNARTQKMEAGMPIPVIITAYADKSFTFEMKTPPATYLIKKLAGVQKGAQNVGKEVVGKLTRAQAEEIATIKKPDLTAADMDAAVRTIAGSARSMGITVEGE